MECDSLPKFMASFYRVIFWSKTVTFSGLIRLVLAILWSKIRSLIPLAVEMARKTLFLPIFFVFPALSEESEPTAGVQRTALRPEPHQPPCQAEWNQAAGSQTGLSFVEDPATHPKRGLRPPFRQFFCFSFIFACFFQYSEFCVFPFDILCQFWPFSMLWDTLPCPTPDHPCSNTHFLGSPWAFRVLAQGFEATPTRKNSGT